MTDTPRDVDCYVGCEIKRRRLLLGLTQEDVADKLGVTFQQLQKYEKGTNRISASRLYDLSKILHCLPGDVFPAPDADFTAIEDEPMSRVEIRIIKNYRGSSFHVRKAVDSLLGATGALA